MNRVAGDPSVSARIGPNISAVIRTNINSIRARKGGQSKQTDQRSLLTMNCSLLPRASLRRLTLLRKGHLQSTRGLAVPTSDGSITAVPTTKWPTESTTLQEAIGATAPRNNWRKEEITSIYNVPLMELAFAAVEFTRPSSLT